MKALKALFIDLPCIVIGIPLYLISLCLLAVAFGVDDLQRVLRRAVESGPQSDEVERLRKDVEHWKANHADMVRRNQELRDRPDLGDRVASVDALHAEVERLRKENADLEQCCNNIYRVNKGLAAKLGGNQIRLQESVATAELPLKDTTVYDRYARMCYAHHVRHLEGLILAHLAKTGGQKPLIIKDNRPCSYNIEYRFDDLFDNCESWLTGLVEAQE